MCKIYISFIQKLKKMIKVTLYRFHSLKTSSSWGGQNCRNHQFFCNIFFVFDYKVKFFGVLKSGTIGTLIFTVI